MAGAQQENDEPSPSLVLLLAGDCHALKGAVSIHRGFGNKGRGGGRGRGGRSKKLHDLDAEFEEFYRRAQKHCLKYDVHAEDWDLRVHEEVPPQT